MSLSLSSAKKRQSNGETSLLFPVIIHVSYHMAPSFSLLLRNGMTKKCQRKKKTGRKTPDGQAGQRSGKGNFSSKYGLCQRSHSPFSPSFNAFRPQYSVQVSFLCVGETRERASVLSHPPHLEASLADKPSHSRAHSKKARLLFVSSEPAFSHFSTIIRHPKRGEVKPRIKMQRGSNFISLQKSSRK